jgi:hypothetical protein
MTKRWQRTWSFSLVWAALSLLACAAPQRAASQALRAEVGAYQLEVLVDGAPVRTFQHEGETHVLGELGSRYVLRVHNRAGRRIEAVISVDGLDVIDGKPADFANKRGYMIDAHDHVDIDGWRLSNREAAAFRFSPLSESYAAKTGSARNVGVIGVAVFPERMVKRSRPVYAPQPSYPTPQSYDGYEQESSRAGAGVGSMAEKSAAAEGRAASARAAPRAAQASPPMDRDDTHAEAKGSIRARGGLGTEFGEALSSEIRHVAFVRASASRPAAFLGARYNDRNGLYALGIDVDARDAPSDLTLRQSADPFPAARGYARPPTDWRRY